MGRTVFGFAPAEACAPERRDVHAGYLAGCREERRGAVEVSTGSKNSTLFLDVIRTWSDL